MFDLAGTLFGNRRDQVAQGSTLTATGSTASADGIAGIVIDADVTPAEGTGDEDVDQTVIDLPTSPDVAEGDEVIVTLVGDGPLKTPIVTANPGSGDRMAAAVQDAHDLAASVEGIAQEAKEVAEATGQHFWPDDDGVHVTEVTQDEWNDSTSPSYHSGANVLLNALGQLFRDGLNNLLALVAGSPGHTYSFTIEDGVYSYPLPFGESIAGDPTISVGGHTLPWSDCQLQFNYENAGYSLLFSGDFDPATYAGQTATMTYNTSSSLSVFDGLGTAAQNIISFFDARGITLLGGRGVIQGNTSKQVGSAITEGGAVVGYNVMDVNVIRLANSSPDPDDAYAYLAIRANETYAADTDGEKIEGDVDYWRSGVQLVSQDDFGKVAVGLATGTVGLQGNHLALSTSDLSASESIPMEQAVAALTTPLYSSQSSVTITTANTDISGPSVTVPAGTYIIVVAYSFPSISGSGTRLTTIGYKPDGGSTQYNTINQGNRAFTRLSMLNVAHITAQTKFTAFVRSDHTISSASALYIGMTRIS